MQSAMYQMLRLLLLVVMTCGPVFAAGNTPVEMDEDDEFFVPKRLQVNTSQDMTALGKLSREKGVPILLMFSTESCTYCQRLETEVLGPMQLDGADPQRVILRKVMMDEYDDVRDFSGRERNAESFSINRGVEVVPTLQLVNATGEELVPKIVGYQTPGLYADYLDKAIQVSRHLLEKK